MNITSCFAFASLRTTGLNYGSEGGCWNKIDLFYCLQILNYYYAPVIKGKSLKNVFKYRQVLYETQYMLQCYKTMRFEIGLIEVAV